MHLHPQGGEKNRRNLQEKFVSAPQADQETILGHFGGEIWRVGMVYLVGFSLCFEGDD